MTPGPNAPALTGGLRAVPLREQATDLLRARIVTGEFRPGVLYAIGHVAEELGVSATPIREALIDLVREDLVEMVRNRGFRIREMSEADLDEVVEVRRMLEVPAIRRVADGHLVGDLTEARALSQAIEACTREADWSGFVAQDRALHLLLLSYLGNKRLVTMVGGLRDLTRLYGLSRVANSAGFAESTHEHDLLLDAVAAGDGERAAQLMEHHLRHTRGIWAGRGEPEWP
ncbi:MAG: GntR family transcriptional regulator [Streptosporangiaceae bacterium]